MTNDAILKIISFLLFQYIKAGPIVPSHWPMLVAKTNEMNKSATQFVVPIAVQLLMCEIS